jgi:hypothetical protein
MTGFQGQKTKMMMKVFQEPLLGDVPKSVDWRDHGYVTPVKDQVGCMAHSRYHCPPGSQEGNATDLLTVELHRAHSL